jgi:hypothetical protein
LGLGHETPQAQRRKQPAVGRPDFGPAVQANGRDAGEGAALSGATKPRAPRPVVTSAPRFVARATSSMFDPQASCAPRRRRSRA